MRRYCGRSDRDARRVCTAVVYVLTSGCVWRTCRRRSGPAVHRTPTVRRVGEGVPVSSAAPGGTGRTR
ncbi:hypothetical protein EF902_35325 [Streptomyces sp. WAC05858]|nr:hypothetical protein EF902_35325 [Streptomyces sp. WAC05858]